ncbi:uncharacterized protein LOC132791061 [Drosophila nasuta]|uniref:uncharacterized protein LOC132791061 n=1 Tax=Drosophila nasuta TaxID=42062 RepID=UPI00295F09B5|nr:uncharacterized protein LOC132791061 [Drosophila nasuta]
MDQSETLWSEIEFEDEKVPRIEKTKSKRARKSGERWSDEEIFQLIRLVENRPHLWDFTNPEYKNRSKREVAWEEIGNHLRFPKAEVCNKWNLLRQQFRNAFGKVQATKSGQAAAARKPPNKYYRALHFMQPILKVDSGSRTSSYRRRVEGTNTHRTDLIKKACKYLVNTKEDDEFELWGKSVAATLRNYPDANAVRLAKSKMNLIMASLEAGELIVNNSRSKR